MVNLCGKIFCSNTPTLGTLANVSISQDGGGCVVQWLYKPVQKACKVAVYVDGALHGLTDYEVGFYNTGWLANGTHDLFVGLVAEHEEQGYFLADSYTESIYLEFEKVEDANKITVYDFETVKANLSGEATYYYSGLAVGEHSIALTATDAAGNESSRSETVDCIVYSMPPPCVDLSVFAVGNKIVIYAENMPAYSEYYFLYLYSNLNKATGKFEEAVNENYPYEVVYLDDFPFQILNVVEPEKALFKCKMQDYNTKRFSDNGTIFRTNENLVAIPEDVRVFQREKQVYISFFYNWQKGKLAEWVHVTCPFVGEQFPLTQGKSHYEFALHEADGQKYDYEILTIAGSVRSDFVLIYFQSDITPPQTPKLKKVVLA